MDSITSDDIEKIIFIIRGQKVMPDSDLAQLYEIDTGAFNRAVRRHLTRFPNDFMFQLTVEEYDSLRCQIGILKNRGKHRKYLPLVFTEQGVAMLSGVLNGDRAVRVNISVMRTFVKLRQLLLEESLSHRVANLRRIRTIFLESSSSDSTPSSGTSRFYRRSEEDLGSSKTWTPLLPAPEMVESET